MGGYENPSEMVPASACLYLPARNTRLAVGRPSYVLCIFISRLSFDAMRRKGPPSSNMIFESVLAACFIRLAQFQIISFADQCSTHYPRLSRSELIAGELPYLFGRKAGGCEACRAEQVYKQFCSFDFNNSLSDFYYASNDGAR